MAPAEWSAVARLWHDAWHDAHGALLPPRTVAERTPESFSKRLAPLAKQSFVVDAGGIPVAFGALWEDEIDQFFVEKSWRGTGVAKLLLSVLERRLAARGVVEARIQCMAGNERAYSFYTRQGWIDRGARELPVWTPDRRVETHPTHLLVKTLGSEPNP